MDYMMNSFSWIIKQNKSQPRPIWNYYQALLRFDFRIQNPHEYDRIQKEGWEEASVEVPLIGFMFQYIDSVNNL